MKALVKMIIGILIAVAGFYWYYANSLYYEALKMVFNGSFGAFLILLGVLIAWIEWEDYRWEKDESQNVEIKKKTVRKAKK